jgi:hypothetical protein
MTPDELFPELAVTGYRITSSIDTQYNCVAWALGFTQKWWWPESDEDDTSFWPAAVPNVANVNAFEALFQWMGYSPTSDEGHRPWIDKLALFVDSEGEPSHVARQLPNGKWTTKLGELEDIEHELRALEGSEYGTVIRIYQRPMTFTPP